MHRSVGVDIIEFSKAKRFYKTHRLRLNSFLSPVEKKFIESSAAPHKSLAKIFAAKEAVFKFLNRSWMGPHGFKYIKILPDKKNQFYCPAFKKTKIAIQLTENKKSVAACCAPACFFD